MEQKRESKVFRMRMAPRIQSELERRAVTYGMDLHEYVRMVLSRHVLEVTPMVDEEPSYEGFRPLGA